MKNINTLASSSNKTVWGKKLILNILDQGLFSGSNFLVNILLARWLSPDHYGFYANTFAIFLLILGFQSSLILEPMVIFGPKKYTQNREEYYSILVRFQFILAAGFCALLFVFMLFFEPVFSAAIRNLAIALPFVINFWLLRQACYIESRPGLAMLGSLLYAVILISSLFLFHQNQMISPGIPWIAFLISCICSSVLLFALLRIRIREVFTWRKEISRQIMIENWKFGKFVLAASTASWLSTTVYVPFVSLLMSLSQAAAFKVMQSLIQPMQQAVRAIYLLVLPWLSKRSLNESLGAIKKTLLKILIGGVVVSILYNLVILIFSKWIIEVLFDQAYYLDYRWLLPFLGINLLINIASQVFGLYIRILEKTKIILLSKAAAGSTILVFGVLATKFWGLEGLIGVILLIDNSNKHWTNRIVTKTVQE